MDKMEMLKPNAERAKTAVLLIWVVLAFEVLSLISSCMQYSLLQSFANGNDISEDVLSANDTREQLIGILSLIVYIVSMVTFILWFRRAYYNLHQKRSGLSCAEGWAAGAWFVPIGNLFLPYQIMKELYQETRNLLVVKIPHIASTFNVTKVNWWWALWIINGLISGAFCKLSMKADTVEELMAVTIINIVTNIIAIPLALLTITVIKDYSKVEILLSEIKDEEETSIV